MAGDAGGSGNTGQTTLGKGQRKLSPGEAGFREGRGQEDYRCFDCFFYENGTCRVVNVSPQPNDLCDNFEPNRRGKMSATLSPNAQVRRGFDEYHDYPIAYVERREFSKEQRMKLAKAGKALPHGGFPIENCGDVSNARRAIGRAKDRAATIAHIKRWHKSLNCKGELPASWKSMAAVEYAISGPLRRVVPVIRQKQLFITKVAEDKQTGIKRWYAKASGTERDLYNERMSVKLFRDFIRRAEARDEVPQPFSSKAWNGGLPYLGVAHYLDLEGLGLLGPTDQLWVDGDLLKARGTFSDGEMAEAAYLSIKADIDDNVPPEERVRISIAFIDWAHEHEGDGTFKRRDLTDRCEMCAEGLGEKVYLAGHLVHLALTRIPAYPTATIELEERTMAKTKRQEDAESIVGETQANSLEEKDRELISRSDADPDIDPNAVVIKDKHAYPDKDASEEEDEEEDEGKKKKGKKASPFGGAKSLAEAEEFLVRAQDGEPVLMGPLNVLAGVLTNIAGVEHNEAISAELADYQTRLDAEVLKTLGDVRNSLKQEAAMPNEDTEVLEEPQAEVAEAEAAPAAADAEAEPVVQEPVAEADAHPLDSVFASLRTSFDEARETPADLAVRLKMLQEPVNELALAIKANIGSEGESGAPGSGVTIEAIQALFQAEVAPLRVEIATLKAANAAVPVGSDSSVRRAIQSGSLLQASSPVRETILPADQANPKTDKNVTPGLRNLVRRTVGLSG